jgi:hypothetical protein
MEPAAWFVLVPLAFASLDQYRTTLQWSRRAIGLKLFMALAERGRSGLADQIDRQARMGDALRAKLNDAGWIVGRRHNASTGVHDSRGHSVRSVHNGPRRPIDPGTRQGLDI